MTYSTIARDEKKPENSGRLIAGAAVLSCLLVSVVVNAAGSVPIVQPTTSLASDTAPAPPAAAAKPKTEPTNCGHDPSLPCSAQDFLDILDQQNWTLHKPLPVDPNKNDCAKDPLRTKEPDIQQGFKRDGNQYDVVGDFATPGACGSRVSADPRVFGPHTWKTFHTMAVNYHSPPTEAAVNACTNFLTALPYLIPCAHCAWDLGQFIQTNVDKHGLFDSDCRGATTEDYDESLCLKPEEACKSQRTFVSFFVRAQNNVNHHVHPCRSSFTIKQAYDTYEKEDGCAHNVVWGYKQLCGGGYASATPRRIPRKDLWPDRKERERRPRAVRPTTAPTTRTVAARKPLLAVAASSARPKATRAVRVAPDFCPGGWA